MKESIKFIRTKRGNYSVRKNGVRIGLIRKRSGFWRAEDSSGWIISEDRYLTTAKSHYRYV